MEKHYCYACRKHLYENLFPANANLKANGRKCQQCLDNIKAQKTGQLNHPNKNKQYKQAKRLYQEGKTQFMESL